MKRFCLQLFIIICALSGGRRAFCAGQQKRPDLDALLTQLRVRTGTVSNDAKFALINRANSDPEAKEYIVERLPPLLESYGGGKDLFENMAWENAVQVAGELKVAAAVSVLCRLIDLLSSPEAGMGASYNFLNRAAVWALIQIGPAAVPAVIGVLKNGTALQREEAAYVLGNIGTPPARQALEERLPEERDTAVRHRIQEVLKRGPWRPPKN